MLGVAVLVLGVGEANRRVFAVAVAGADAGKEVLSLLVEE